MRCAGCTCRRAWCCSSSRSPSRWACSAPARLGWLALAGVLLWILGFVFETVGDWQLARFKADPARRGTVLDTGLWRYTRHPNYFGDAAVWAGLFLVAADSWPGVLTVLSPALMIWTLAGKTGKPLTEKAMSARPGYKEYIEVHLGLHPVAAPPHLTARHRAGQPSPFPVHPAGGTMAWRPKPSDRFYRVHGPHRPGAALALPASASSSPAGSISRRRNRAATPPAASSRPVTPGTGAVVAITHFGYLDFAFGELLLWRHTGPSCGS